MQRVAFALLALCASCGPLRELKLPSEGGKAWTEYASEHFRLQTDMPEPEARATLKDIEERRSGLVRAAFHGAVVATQPSRVVCFRNREEVLAFVPWFILGYFTYDPMGEKLMVLAQYENDGLRVFAHEMSHDVSSAYFARQPRWLGEGLAQFLETLKIERSRDRVVLGVPDLSFAMTPAGLRTDYKTPIPIPAVFERERVGELPDYPTSWALIFYLANEEGRGFNEFQKALFRGQEPDDAWKASFPAYADAAGLRALDGKVQAAVRELIKTKRYRAATVPFLEYAGKIETRTMQDSEVRSLRAELRLNSPHPRSEHRFILGWARDDAQAAARENPAEVRAIALLIQLAESRHEKLQLARSATVAAPDDYRAWLLTDLALADEEGSPDEEAGRLSDLERAVSLSPANPKALERLARAYARAGKGAKAIPFIRKSLDAYPDNASALDTYALIASVQGSCPAAWELERMAVNRLPHRPEGESKRDSPSTPFEKRAARMRDRLAEYERACPGN